MMKKTISFLILLILLLVTGKAQTTQVSPTPYNKNLFKNPKLTPNPCPQQQQPCSTARIALPNENAIEGWTYTPTITIDQGSNIINGLDNRPFVMLGPNQITCISQ
jgi:hypothetical protein